MHTSETHDAGLSASEIDSLCSSLADRVAAFLLPWYIDHGRSLPWRAHVSPYHTWVSEIMLQQTQVDKVIPYYLRFLDHFPNVQALAATEMDELLALWQGLGYYARARNLHAAAQQIVQDHGAQVPQERRALLALPGIADYTASAILSIAYGQDYPAVDGNVKRILTRLLDYDREIGLPQSVRELKACAARLVPAGRAGAFNQALMDLGATVCIPRTPRCGLCPLSEVCRARAAGTQEQRPVRAARGPLPLELLVGVHAVRVDGSWLAVRRPPRGLLGGLWEIPCVKCADDPDAEIDTIKRDLAAPLGLSLDPEPRSRRIVRHAYTHKRVQLVVYRCRVTSEPAPAANAYWDAFAWLRQDTLADYGLTGLTLKALKVIGDPQGTLL